MRRPSRPLLALALAAIAPLASADDCAHSEQRSLAPDLAGVERVVFEVGAQDLDLAGLSDGAPSLQARACASDPAYLPQLRFSQRREGSTLVVEMSREGYSSGVFFKPTYAYLDVQARLPTGLAYEVRVGSGDARVSRVASLESRVGSGDLEVSAIAGRFSGRVGSGDIEARDVGELRIDSIGSGDVEVHEVRGDALVGSIGSGDLDLDGVGGRVEIDSIGSGDASVHRVAGDVRLHRLGSGDFDTSAVQGRVERPAD